MSNHYHLVLTDPDARLPAFQQLLDALVARALNALHGRWEAFWGPDSFSAVTLIGPKAIVDKTAYTLANPVTAGLVRSGCRWPGLWSSPESIGTGERLVVRPRHFFDPDGALPESVRLKLELPSAFDSAATFRELLDVAQRERESLAGKRVSKFLGLARILAQRVTARPGSMEPRRGLRPRVAGRDTWKRIEVLGRLKSFLAQYRTALQEWQTGDRGARFPFGTYQMRVMHGATCAGAG
jgi:hypothetical protein